MNESLSMNIATWIGIGFCIAQSAMFSGLNLAVFSISRLRLEVKASTGDRDALKVLGASRGTPMKIGHPEKRP